MRIARLVSGFPPGGKITGSLLPNIYYLSLEEIKQGHETAIFTYGEHGESQEVLDGIPIYRTKKPRLSRFFLGGMLLRKIRKTGFSPDVIHSMNAMPLGWPYDRHATRRLGASCVLSVHTPVLQNERFSLDKRYRVNKEYALLLKRLAKRVDLNIAVSRFVRNELVKIGVDVDRIRVIPSGLRTDLFRPQPFPDPLPEEFNCLYVGRTAKIKGLENLVMAADILRNNHHSIVKFHLVGGTAKDEDYGKIRSLITDLELQDRVIMCPPVPHKELPDIYRQCDCLVLPSNREPLGKVVLEAMSSCRSVIASRAGGIPDLVWDGKNGILFESKDPDSLANRLSKLLDDPKLARKLASRGVGFAKRFDWKRISKMYVEAFESTLGK